MFRFLNVFAVADLIETRLYQVLFKTSPGPQQREFHIEIQQTKQVGVRGGTTNLL